MDMTAIEVRRCSTFDTAKVLIYLLFSFLLFCTCKCIQICKFTHTHPHTHTHTHTHTHWGKHSEEDVTFNISTDSIKTINTPRFGLIELYSVNAIPANKRDDYLKQLLSVRMNMSVESPASPTPNKATESCGVLVLNRNLGIVASLNTFLSVLCCSVGSYVHCMLLLPLSVL